MTVAQTEDYRGYRIVIEYDEDAESPRDWDNLGTMVCWHTRRNLGDPLDANPWWDGRAHGADGHTVMHHFYSWLAERRRERKSKDAGVLVVPIFAYEHSGITLRASKQGVNPFHCPWDSGQCGFIYITHEKMREEYSERVTKALKDRVTGYLVGEVATYDAWLTGQVYEWSVGDGEDDRLDSCCGCYDGENEYGGAYALSEAKAAIDHRIDHQGKHPAPFTDDDDDEGTYADNDSYYDMALVRGHL